MPTLSLEKFQPNSPPADGLWFAAKGEVYVEDVPRYFFSAEDVPSLTAFEERGEDIITEYNQVTAEGSPLYQTYFEDHLVSPAASWDTIPLYVFGVKRPEAAYFPLLTSLIEADPQVVGCSFSRVTPQSEVHPHSGATNAVHRCHMGIRVPEGPPDVVGMQVGPKRKGWTRGRFFAFNDANYHATWNHTDEERVIMIVDVMRPEFQDEQFYTFSRIGLSYVLLKTYEKTQSPLMDRFVKSQLCKRTANKVARIATPAARVWSMASRWRGRAGNR